MGMIAKLITKIFDIGNQNLISKIDELNVKLDETKPLLEFVKKQEYLEIHNGYKRHIEAVRNENRPVRVAFFVMNDSTFSMEQVFKLMVEYKNFEPFIVPIPDLVHYPDKKQFYKTYEYLKNKYHGYVKFPYLEEADSFIDYSDEIDIACTTTPYDTLLPEVYRISYFAKKGIPTFYASYAFNLGVWPDSLIDCEENRLLWKFILQTRIDFGKMKKDNLLKGQNCIVLGYPKMDALYYCDVKPRNRKRIILAPHWAGEGYHASFYEYSDLYLELPKKYSDIDFVFRPHPLLRSFLQKEWGLEKADSYYEQMGGYANVELQEGGSYMDTFRNSDALIHDCSSFSAEYLYTGNPACFIVSDRKLIDSDFNDLGRDCVKQHYVAYSKDEVFRFIDEVVLQGKDTMKEQRQEFFEKYLKESYPDCSKKLMEYFTQIFAK